MKRWTAEEEQELENLYESGDKTCLPCRLIPGLLNEEFGNGRTMAACQRRLYVRAAKMRRERGWDLPNETSRNTQANTQAESED